MNDRAIVRINRTADKATNTSKGRKAGGSRYYKFVAASKARQANKAAARAW